MLLPAAVNYPCQPSRIKHRSCRPVHSLTRAVLPAAPHKLQNKWLVVSSDAVLGLACPPRHRHPPQHWLQHRAGSSCWGRQGQAGPWHWGMDSPLESTGSCQQGQRERGTGRQQHRHRLPAPANLRCRHRATAQHAGWFISCAPGTVPSRVPCRAVLGITAMVCVRLLRQG